MRVVSVVWTFRSRLFISTFAALVATLVGCSSYNAPLPVAPTDAATPASDANAPKTTADAGNTTADAGNTAADAANQAIGDGAAKSEQ